MGSAITMGNLGVFTSSRLARIINSSDKDEAQKLCLLDRFKDLFRDSDNKKVNRIGKLWDAIHGKNDKLNLSTNHSRISSPKPGTALYKIIAFDKLDRLVNLATNNSSESFNFTVTSDNSATFELKINGTLITRVPTSDAENECKIYGDGMVERSPQDTLLTLQHWMINEGLPEEKHSCQSIQDIVSKMNLFINISFIKKTTALI